MRLAREDSCLGDLALFLVAKLFNVAVMGMRSDCV